MKSNAKFRLWSATKVVALVLALAIGQVITGGAVQSAYAGDECYPPPPPPPTAKKGNNGWGNGGNDGINPGSDKGGGVSQGGPGAGSSQSSTKFADRER